MSQEFFMYREYPLVRSGNQIYYGYMSDPYVVMMQIVHQQKSEDSLALADKIQVYQMSTNEPNPMKAIVQKANRSSLYDAVDLAHAWLKRAEKEMASR